MSAMDAQSTNDVRKRRPASQADGASPPSPPTRERGKTPPPPLSFDDVSHLLSLLINLCISSYSAQALVTATFGKTFGPMSFHFATFASVLLFSFVNYASPAAQKRALATVTVLQVVTAVFARGASAIAAERVENPTLGALAVHGLLALPLLGIGGGVWLQWISKLLDPEPTLVGKLLTKAVSCVAVSSLVNFLEPLIGPAVLQFSTLTPSTALNVLAMMSFTLSVLAYPEPARSSTAVLTKLVIVFSVCIAAIAFSAPPYPPPSIAVLHQHITPSGLLMVAETTATSPPVRYLRQDASIVGVSEILDPNTEAPKATVDPGSLIYKLSAVEAINDLVRHALLLKGKNALVLGFKTGLLTNSLVEHGYNTTVVEPDRYLYDVAQAFFVRNLPHAVHIEAPTRWMWKSFARNASGEQHITPYDVVVHDLARGGELPAQFYTMEMWEALKLHMNDEAIIVVNYLGKPNSISFKSTVNMLQNVFTTCNAYHPNPLNELPLVHLDKLTNIIIFCTPSTSLSFRTPSESELNLGIRDDIFRSLPQRQIDLKVVLRGTPRDRFLLRDADPKVKSWGKENINGHWKLMRSWFPSDLWSSYTG